MSQQSDNEDLEAVWENLMGRLAELVGKRPADLNAVLFLVGIQELGKGALRFTKEQKQDLMHVGLCRVLSISGYYELERWDDDGWPHYKLVQALPFVDLMAQESFLKMHVVEYFREI